MVVDLLKRGANPNISSYPSYDKREEGTTSYIYVLLKISYSGDPEGTLRKIFEAILSKSKPDFLNKSSSFANGPTPMHIAAEMVDEKLIKAILKAGGDPNKTDKLGQTPVDTYTLLMKTLSRKQPDQDIITLFVDKMLSTTNKRMSKL
jgi:ankyrin repeat protein